MKRVRVCAASELPPGGAIRICETGTPIAVFNVAGTFYATDDTCTHGKASLVGEGSVDGDTVECGWHRGRFSILTGKATRYPATKPLRTYSVQEEGGDLFVEIAEEAG